jgi:hypothetical protein
MPRRSASACSVHYYPLSMIHYHISQLFLSSQDNPGITRHNTPEKVKDNQLFHSCELSPLKSRQFWLGKSWIPASNSMKTGGKLMDPYLCMWPASKGVRKGTWQCKPKGQPVLSHHQIACSTGAQEGPTTTHSRTGTSSNVVRHPALHTFHQARPSRSSDSGSMRANDLPL